MRQSWAGVAAWETMQFPEGALKGALGMRRWGRWLIRRRWIRGRRPSSGRRHRIRGRRPSSGPALGSSVGVRRSESVGGLVGWFRHRVRHRFRHRVRGPVRCRGARRVGRRALIGGWIGGLAEGWFSRRIARRAAGRGVRRLLSQGGSRPRRWSRGRPIRTASKTAN